jgi:N-acetyl-1-D-myo-inositol-2-amino-2-deoxy-alpha-D-glucopyranoside deacetylase
VTWRLAGVFAHPDDDTFSNAGILAMEGDGLSYTLVVATSGEAGLIADPALATPENLGRVREGEERAALDAVGHDAAHVVFLRYPDGGLKDVARDELVDRVAETLHKARPHVVLTFGPEGVTRHEDHIAAGQACTEAFHRLRSDADSGGAFQRLLYCAIPQTELNRFRQELQIRGIDPGDPEAPFAARGVPDSTIAFRVDCGRVIDRKLTALQAHATQREELDSVPEDLWMQALGEECFVQAWPPAAEGNPPLPTVFHGLTGE